MDASEIFVRIFSIADGIYQSERARRRSKQRGAELKELGNKVVEISSRQAGVLLKTAPESEKMGKKGVAKIGTGPNFGLSERGRPP